MSGSTPGPDDAGATGDEDHLRSSRGETDSSPLHRRTVLRGFAATGTAGALSASGLYGLDAVLSDTELFGDGTTEGSNSFRTGEVDLGLAWESYYDPVEGPRERVRSAGDCEDGVFVDDTQAAFQLSGVQPGDSGSTEFCLQVAGNPGWLWVETSCPEPGLEKALEASLRFDAGCDGELSSMVTASDDSVTELSGSLCSVLATLGGGVRLGTACADPGTTHCLTLEWSFPEPEYRNQYEEYEGTELTFELEFSAVQCRHNPDPRPPTESQCEPRRCFEEEPPIDLIAYCTEHGQLGDEDVEQEILETTADGHPNKLGWRADRQLSTVVLSTDSKDGRTFENFDVDDGAATGTAAVGEGDEQSRAAVADDQSPSSPAPAGESAIVYVYDETTGTFDRDQ